MHQPTPEIPTKQNDWPDIENFVYETAVDMIFLSFEDLLHYMQAHFVRREMR